MKSIMYFKITLPASFLCCLIIPIPQTLTTRKKVPCKINSMGGEHPEEVCRIIKYLREFKKFVDHEPPHNIYIIAGETGIGKSTVSQAIPAEAEIPHEYQDSNEIVKTKVSQINEEENTTADEKVERACDKAEKQTENGKRPVVLIFDDVEAFARKDIFTQPAAQQAAYRALHSKLDYLKDKRAIITILVTKDLREINQAIRERAIIISYKPTTEEDRKDIFAHYKKKQKQTIQDKTIRDLTKKYSKFKARDIKIAFRYARNLAHAEDCEYMGDDHLIEACTIKQEELDLENPSYLMIVKSYFSGLFS